MSNEKLYMETSESVCDLMYDMNILPSVVGKSPSLRPSLSSNATVYAPFESDEREESMNTAPAAQQRNSVSDKKTKKVNASLQVHNHMAFRLAFIFSITIFCGFIPLLLNAILDESIYYPCSFVLIGLFLTIAGMALYSIFSDSEKVLRGIQKYNTDSTYRFSNESESREKSIPSSLCDLQQQLDSFFNAVELANMQAQAERDEEKASAGDEQPQSASKRDRYVKELITNLSHEIRTPLSNLKLTAECLEDGVYDFNDDNMRKVSAEISKIDKTFTAIKSYSVASAEIDKTATCNAGDLIESACARAKAIADFTADKTSVDCHLSEGYKTASAELQNALLAAPALPMGSVFGYIVDNAFKHATGMTVLEFDARLNEDSVIFYVKDNGCGTDADRDSLCAPFWKVDASHTTAGRSEDEISLGLGLSMADDIVSACDGSLDIISSAGSGMQVEIRLPLA